MSPLNRDSTPPPAVTVAVSFAKVVIRATVDRANQHGEPVPIVVTGPPLLRRDYVRLHRAIRHIEKLIGVLHGDSLAVTLRRIPEARFPFADKRGPQ